MTERTTTRPHPAEPDAAAEDPPIRPFQVSVPEEELVELRRRIAATRWPERETVADASQGVRLVKNNLVNDADRQWNSALSDNPMIAHPETFFFK